MRQPEAQTGGLGFLFPFLQDLDAEGTENSLHPNHPREDAEVTENSLHPNPSAEGAEGTEDSFTPNPSAEGAEGTENSLTQTIRGRTRRSRRTAFTPNHPREDAEVSEKAFTQIRRDGTLAPSQQRMGVLNRVKGTLTVFAANAPLTQFPRAHLLHLSARAPD
jgi:hypothetical protein